ncbi:SLIT-ROBO Rho GTPase-activating protein 1 isoform X3 [Lingula anatina]|uniref:SLIT-ROBO Rho GTPase-activating protein 1 isoform X3 n=1 Tax=Lingula anatina TaxID=7574 RepID=A0A1S3JRI3_LINAN|nr:SLIT-ROBO Rho GTPase-activating protein 1 isoform X3 [Lingula anatina]|eukprot:XP_013412995.1 SLIT-ROBO Rho GTPase-activating protein 1 isoform X3 [Lingula anatina]
MPRGSFLWRCTFSEEDFTFYTPLLIDIRQQLNEQLKCLDLRLENQMAMVAEIQDFFKKRAEVEQEYSRNLDRLVKQVMVRHKADKQRRESWHLYSTYTCWQHLLAMTKKQSKDHGTVGDIYGNIMVQRLSEVMEDAQRMYKAYRDIGVDSHEEILSMLNKLQTAMKTYHIYYNESKQAENKLKTAESQKVKVEQHAGKSGLPSRKYRSIEKQAEKRQNKYQENKLKALKSRNEYLLTIDAANAALHKYSVDDLSDLLDGMDYGYHAAMARLMMTTLSVEENVKNSHKFAIDLLNKGITDVGDARLDKKKFLESNSTIFALPKKFEFQAHKGDEVIQVSAQKSVQDELVQRYDQLSKRLEELKLENDEVWKSLEAADKTLMEMITSQEYDVTPYFQDPQKVPPKSPSEVAKLKSNRSDIEVYYLEKFKEYVLGSNKVARLQAQHTSIQKALGEGVKIGQTTRPPSLPPKPRKRRIGKAPTVGQPKLFGGSIEEYAEVTGVDVPLIIRSCVRIINLYGMHNQGVFRVSGSQLEINEFKAAFEKGEDPLIEMTDNISINSVAGVLKLYFRELREPIFPTQMFDALIDCTRIDNVKDSITRLRELITQLPRPVFVVLRYLFSFLNHLSEFSDENMMDPYNLAICFGPTLLPVPGDKDPVTYQSYVNDLIKLILSHQEEIFPNDDGGTVYERMMMEEGSHRCSQYLGDRELAELSDEEDEVDDDVVSEDDHLLVQAFLNKLWTITEPEVTEAVALYDFEGRTGRELSFKKGDQLLLYSQVSSDWWDGYFNGKEGLIPDKYIKIAQTPRDFELTRQVSQNDKRRSTESLPAKTYSASGPKVDEPLTVGPLDKSVSQPNISVDRTDRRQHHHSRQDSSDQSLGSITSKSTDSVSLSELSLTSGDSKDNSTDDLERDLDHALSEVMTQVESLGKQEEGLEGGRRDSGGRGDVMPLGKNSERTRSESGTSSSFGPQANRKFTIPPNPKHTPDLVLDLPPDAKDTESPSPPQDQSDPDSPTSGAETFAKSNQCTLKKGMSNSMPRSLTHTSTFRAGMDVVGEQGDVREGGVVKRSVSTSATISARTGRSLPPAYRESPERSVPSPTPSMEKASSPGPAVAPKPSIKARPPVMKKPPKPGYLKLRGESPSSPADGSSSSPTGGPTAL